jgi:hypothetical protein
VVDSQGKKENVDPGAAKKYSELTINQ